MPRSLPVRAQLRARTLLSLKPHHWFGLYLATAALPFFAASPFLALPAHWIQWLDRAVQNDTLVLLLTFEAVVLGWAWVELRRRRNTDKALTRIRAIQHAISSASERIVIMNAEDLDEGLQRELGVVRELLRVDQIAWFQRSVHGQSYEGMQTSGAGNRGLNCRPCGLKTMAWMADTVNAGKPVLVADLDELPAEEAEARQLLKQAGVMSLAVIPSNRGTGVTGALVIASFWTEIVWEEQLVAQVAILASMFATAHTRKLSQEAAQASELRFRQLFDDSPIGIALMSSNGQIRIANAALARLLARTNDELANKSIIDLTFPDDMPRTWLEIQELLAGVKDLCRIEERLRRKDGSERWVRITMSVVGARNNNERYVLAMVEDRTEAVRVKEQLEDSRLMLALALEASRTTAWEYDPPGDRIAWLDRSRLQEPASDLFSNVLRHVVPEDWERLRNVTQEIVRSGGVFSTEFRMIGKDGTVRWMLGRGRLSQRSTSQSPKIVGVTVDVSGLKQAQLELQELAKRLMEAQEAERKKISRELHDDVGQRVALLAMELDIVAQLLPEDDQLKARVERIQLSAEELSGDLHQISHTLHSSKLQYLGLQAALRELCQRISDNHDLVVELESSDEKPYLREEEALAIYRVAQEALNNVVRHSSATKAKITIVFSETHVELAIADDGKGFDTTSLTGGIGLIGMRERIRAVGGEFRIVSAKTGGTEIRASVTLPNRNIAAIGQAAAGS